MNNSVKEARWLLFPVFGLWGLIAIIGVTAG
jgi:hypothetical protein